MKVVVVGGGICGLSTGMLLADDGHDVTVLERDRAPKTAPRDAFGGWERRGVNQFRLPHFFASRFRTLLCAELPRVAEAMRDAGSLEVNFLSLIPESLTGGVTPADDGFTTITGRRAVVESVFAACAEETPGLTVRRGIAVAGLAAASGRTNAVPHVTGVIAESGESIGADLVVDAGGRRSALPRWLGALGGPVPEEELEDSGFCYFGRHFVSRGGGLPALIGPLVQDYGSVSAATLPADNDTWSVTIFAAMNDAAVRGLRDVTKWEAAIRSMPLVAHWIDADPIEDTVVTMTKIEDRRRCYVINGSPVATGVVPVADAWACTNPSLGRGVSIGLLHSVTLRNLLRTGEDDPKELARSWGESTESVVRPWYDATLFVDRHRLQEIEAIIKGVPYEPADPEWEFTKSLANASGKNPDCLRAVLAVAGVRTLPSELGAEVKETASELGGTWRDEPVLGPNRTELLDIVGE